MGHAKWFQLNLSGFSSPEENILVVETQEKEAKERMLENTCLSSSASKNAKKQDHRYATTSSMEEDTLTTTVDFGQEPVKLVGDAKEELTPISTRELQKLSKILTGL